MEKKKGNPYVSIALILNLFAIFIFVICGDYVICGSLLSLLPKAIVGGVAIAFVLGGLCSYEIFDKKGYSPILSFVSLIIIFVSTSSIFMCLGNFGFDRSPEIRYYVYVIDAKEYNVSSVANKGAKNAFKGSRLYLTGWEGSGLEQFSIKIKNGTASNYKVGDRVAISIRNGYWNIKYYYPNTVKVMNESYDNSGTIVKTVDYTKLHDKVRNINDYNWLKEKLAKEKEKHRQKVFYDPKSPDFGKEKLPKEIYEKLSDKDKLNYRQIRKKIIEGRKKEKTPSDLFGY